jgi:hypothetical protein
MDTLALLCNLHADGPATLQRLRRAGCESLAALRRLDPLVLAERLEWNERMAERFLREAALLSGRVEPEEDDAEGEEPEFELESTLVEEIDDEAEGEEELEEDEEAEIEEEESVAFAPPPERVEAVLGAWRELDRVAPPSEPGEFVIPRPPPAPDRELALLALPGLTHGLRVRLAELGVRTLRELVGARELELARLLPLGFTRVKHLQFQAARALDGLPAAEPEPGLEAAAGEAAPESAHRPASAFETFAPPPSEPFETAGPFA